MENFMLPEGRRREVILTAAGGGGGGGPVAGGVDGLGDLPSGPPKQLRRKSVSFTGNESFQVLRNDPPREAPGKTGPAVGGGKGGAPPVGVAPASTFFLRSNRTTSPMVTPHAAFAAHAKTVPPNTIVPTAAAAAAAAAATATAAPAAAPASRGATPHPNRGPAEVGGASFLPLMSGEGGAGGEAAASFSIPAHAQFPPPLPPHHHQSGSPFDPTREVAMAVAAARPLNALPATLHPQAYALPSREEGVGGDVGYFMGASGGGGGYGSSLNGGAESAFHGYGYGNRGGGGGAMRTVVEERRTAGAAEETRSQETPSPSLTTPADDAMSEDSGGGKRGGESGEFRGGVGVREGGNFGRAFVDNAAGADGGAFNPPHERERERVLPIRGDVGEGGDGGGGGGRVDGEAGRSVSAEGLPALGKLETSPSAPYEDVIDREVEEEEEEEEEEGEEYETGDNNVEESPYFSDDNCDARNDEATYTPGMSGSRGGGSWSGGGTDADVYSAPPPRGKRDKWEIGSRYRFIRTLGHGSYGEVAQCEDLLEGGLVAVKRVLNVFDSEVDAKRIYREMFILRHMRHEEIIHLKDVILPPAYDDFRDLYLVFEFVDTDLYKLIGSPQFLTDDHIKLFLYQMLIGLKYVHSAHVIHRDIKPANILLNEDCTVKVCDFGLSRVVTQEPSNDPVPPPAASVCSSGAGKLACSPVKPSTSSDPPGVAAHVAAAGGVPRGGADKGEDCQGGAGAGAGSGTASDGADSEDEPPKERRILKRQLTKHVVTRWYRAPELILLQDYDNAVDVWSLGCIFAELLSMQKESFPTSQERNALFPGKSCFPLSAEKPSSYSDALDQLNVIFDVIGTPSREDIADLGDVSQYLAKLRYKPPLNLGDKYPGASHQALELLACMLRFDPSRRITVDQALEHPYLASCRRPEREVTARVPITMEFENLKTDKATLKRLVYEEVLHYHRDQTPSPPLCKTPPPSSFARRPAPHDDNAEEDSSPGSRKRSRDGGDADADADLDRVQHSPVDATDSAVENSDPAAASAVAGKRCDDEERRPAKFYRVESMPPQGKGQALTRPPLPSGAAFTHLDG